MIKDRLRELVDSQGETLAVTITGNKSLAVLTNYEVDNELFVPEKYLPVFMNKIRELFEGYEITWYGKYKQFKEIVEEQVYFTRGYVEKAVEAILEDKGDSIDLIATDSLTVVYVTSLTEDIKFVSEVHKTLTAYLFMDNEQDNSEYLNRIYNRQEISPQYVKHVSERYVKRSLERLISLVHEDFEGICTNGQGYYYVYTPKQLRAEDMVSGEYSINHIKDECVYPCMNIRRPTVRYATKETYLKYVHDFRLNYER